MITDGEIFVSINRLILRSNKVGNYGTSFTLMEHQIAMLITGIYREHCGLRKEVTIEESDNGIVLKTNYTKI